MAERDQYHLGAIDGEGGDHRHASARRGARDHLRERIDRLEAHMEHRFALVDERFNRIDERFNTMEARFDASLQRTLRTETLRFLGATAAIVTTVATVQGIVLSLVGG